MSEQKYIGYVKYEGPQVKEGMLDARKASEALLGLDYALRHFACKQLPALKELDFEIPVRIKKGSWEALIPETIGGWIQASLGIVATAYFTKAAQKMAESDFDDVGLRDIFRKSLVAIKWVARIGKHLGNMKIKTFPDVTFKQTEEDTLVGIKNSTGDTLFVPKEFIEFYVECSPKVLEKLASNISDSRTLVIGTVEKDKNDEEKISSVHKAIFCTDDDELAEDILFPELVHNDEVVLTGEVTRENKTSNSMGFKYMDHILTSYPQSGNIVPYKDILFLRCRLFGVVSRLDEKGRISAKRPKLIFSHIEPLEDGDDNSILFE
jgi:hypothetical protein